MDAIRAKEITDVNFINTRNQILITVIQTIKESAINGSYYCEYEFDEESNYHDFKYVENQLTSLGYNVNRIESEVRLDRSRTVFTIQKTNIKISISWGS